MAQHNFTSNRLRHYVEFFSTSKETDVYGVPTDVDTFVFDCRADVDEKSGAQTLKYGATMTNQIITVLTYFNTKVNSAMVVMYNGARYHVDNIQTSGDAKSMIVTCSTDGLQEFEQ